MLGGTAILSCGHTHEGRESTHSSAKAAPVLITVWLFRKMYSNALLKGECTALDVYSNM